MTLRKITIDNSVKYITQKEQPRERDSKPDTLLRKQNKQFSQNNKKFIKDYMIGEGFRVPEGIMNCYF